MNPTLQLIIACVGFLFAFAALVLTWSFMFDTVRGVKMPNFQDIRGVANLLFALGLLLLSFLVYKVPEDAYALHNWFFLAQFALWLLTLVMDIILMICSSKGRKALTNPLTSAICKGLLNLLVLYAILM